MVGTTICRAKDAPSKPTLHVECCTKQPESSPPALAEKVEIWLRKRFVIVKLKQTFSCLDGFQNPTAINFITVADLTASINLESHVDIHLAGVNINVDVFELHGDEEQVEPSEDTRLRIAQDSSNDVSKPQAKMMSLPNRNLHGVWDSLIFEDPIQFRLLKVIIRMMSFSVRQRRQKMSSWSGIVMLYGPPGTGKTSLCQALAQQVSIRLSNIFSLCKLVEFDAHSMFSQYFGESGKVVNRIFAMIESMLDEDENALVCVFIDEIESLAGKRQGSGTSHEPQDSLRAVNAFLIALDRLRDRTNVLVFCTSNLIKAVDSAFLDRVDIKQYIPDPGPRARYEILRSCYLELARCGVIALVRQAPEAATSSKYTQEILLDGDEDELGNGPPRPQHSAKASKSQDDFHVLDDRELPPHHLMLLHYPAEKQSLPRTLWKIAAKSTTLSARTLRRLPVMSLAMYAKQDPCPIDEALGALSQAVDKESLQQQEVGTEDMKMIDR